jgi:hypothetical protein
MHRTATPTYSRNFEDILIAARGIAMTRKFAFMFATTVAIAATVPQVAHASCSGNACSAYSYVDGKFTNTDKDRQIHLTGCFLTPSSTCNGSFDVTVDAKQAKAVTAPAGAGAKPKLDVKTAVFVGPPPPAASTPAHPPNLRLKSAAELEKEIDETEKDLAKANDELNKVDSKAKLEELKKRASKDRESIDRVKTILNGRQRSVIETNPSDWTVVQQKTTDVGAKAEAFQKKVLRCVLAGDLTQPDPPKPGSTPPNPNVAPATNIDPSTPGKHAVGCKKEF